MISIFIIYFRGKKYDRKLYTESEINRIVFIYNIKQKKIEKIPKRFERYNFLEQHFQYHPSYNYKSLFLFDSHQGIRKTIGEYALSDLFKYFFFFLSTYTYINIY